MHSWQREVGGTRGGIIPIGVEKRQLDATIGPPKQAQHQCGLDGQLTDRQGTRVPVGL